jgi:hypothetical protein
MHELQQHKPWFEEEYLGILDQRKQAKIQWIQDPQQRNVDNLNSVRLDAIKHFRNKEKIRLIVKIEESETKNEIKKHHGRV